MPRRKKKMMTNGNTKKSSKNKLRLALIGIVAVLATVKLVFASLWGLQMACGPPPTPSIPETTKQKTYFWQKEEALPAPDTQRQAALLCRSVWAVVEYVPFFTPPKQKPIQKPPECQEETKPNPLQKLSSIFKKGKRSAAAAELQTAFSKEIILSKSQEKISKALNVRFREHTDHFDERIATVAWNGPGGSRWYSPNLLASYLRIMKWPEDLETHFPFKLCSKGCSAERALSHTLEWREKYKPWLMSPCAILENNGGFVYMRGHGRSLKRENSGHAMVWIRAGIKTNGVTDPECYFRAILNSLDMAVADTLHRSHQKVGKFNVVLDAAHASFHMLPNLGDTKKAIVMLQDHFPDRLGMVILANLSKASEFLLNMIKPLITKEVRDKILVLPGDAIKRQRILEAIVEQEFIPDYLGGTDTYRFDAKEYYRHKRHQWTDAEAKEYLQTMPYHA